MHAAPHAPPGTSSTTRRSLAAARRRLASAHPRRAPGGGPHLRDRTRSTSARAAGSTRSRGRVPGYDRGPRATAMTPGRRSFSRYWALPPRREDAAPGPLQLVCAHSGESHALNRSVNRSTRGTPRASGCGWGAGAYARPSLRSDVHARESPGRSSRPPRACRYIRRPDRSAA